MLSQLSGARMTEETKPLTPASEVSSITNISSISRSLLQNNNNKSTNPDDRMNEARRISTDSAPNKYRKAKMRTSKSVDYERLPQDDPSNSPPIEPKNRNQISYFDESQQKYSMHEKLPRKVSPGRRPQRQLSEGVEFYRKLSADSGKSQFENIVASHSSLPPPPATASAAPPSIPVNEARPLTLKHPTKKLLRTSSESAIQVNRLIRQRTISCSRPQSEGIVCSNNDLEHILKLAKNHKKDTKRDPNKRPVSSIGRLMSLPEFIPTSDGKENLGIRRHLANFERVGRSAEAPAATGLTLAIPNFSSTTSLNRHSSPSSSTTMNKSNPLTHVLTSSSNEHIFPNVIYEGNYESEEELTEFELKPISESIGTQPEPTPAEPEACETTLTEETPVDATEDDGASTDAACDLSSILSAFNPELLGKAIEARLAVEIKQRDSDDSDEEHVTESRKSSHSKKHHKSGETWVPNQEQQGSKWQSLLAKLNLRKKEDNSGTGVKV